ncbi:MAG: HEAT repeat domain-containing protein [Sandaracinus sp.]
MRGPIANFSSLQSSHFGCVISAGVPAEPVGAIASGPRSRTTPAEIASPSPGHSTGRAAPPAATLATLFAIVIVIVTAIVPASATASPLPFEASVPLGHPTTVHVVAGEADTHVRATAGRRVAEASVPVPLDDASVEALETTTGPVAIVRGTGGGRAYAWVLVERAGAPAIAWSGRTDLHGDPGERTADVLELRDRTGDGRPDVVVGLQREGFRGCDGEPLLLDPSSLDRAGAIRPVTLGRIAGTPVDLVAATQSPGPTAPPIAGVLRMTAETSALGVDDAGSLRAPTSLTDGSPATAWVEGRGAAGEGEMVVARVDAPRALRALALVRATGEGIVAPRSVLVAGGDALYRVELPASFDRVWVALPAPASWTCMAVVLEHGPSDEAGLHVGLGEIEAYTELDYGGGIASLVETLVAEGADAERTADWLARAGSPALEALSASWERLSALGHRRAVRIAAAHAGDPVALALLGRASLDESDEVRADAIAVLVRGREAGARTLAEAASAPQGEAAAEALAGLHAAWDVRPLLDALARPEGPSRPALRHAIGAGLAQDDAGTAEALASFRSGAPVAALAALALAVSETRPDLARDVIAQARPTAEGFEDRWRLVSAAAHATASAENDAWLASVATDAPEWMLRDAALSALGLRSAPAIAHGLGDESPRVRRTTVAILAHDESATSRLLERATRDPWPLVRVAALEALAGRPEELDTLHGRLADRSPMVRERAIQILTERRDASAWALLAPIFADDDEWPRVTAAALDYASALCVADATPQIEAVVGRGIREGAWAPHVDVAVQALRVAMRLGGEARATAETLARRTTSEAFGPLLEGQGLLPACPAPLP